MKSASRRAFATWAAIWGEPGVSLWMHRVELCSGMARSDIAAENLACAFMRNRNGSPRPFTLFWN